MGQGLSASPVYSSRTFVAVGPGWFVHGSGQRYELTVRDTDFRPMRMIRWAGWDTPISLDEVEAHRQQLLESATQIPAETLTRLEAALYSPEALPERRPALGNRAFVDRLERIWVSRHNVALPEAVQEWYVSQADGRPLWRLALPPGAQLRGVNEDRVMFLVRDQLDVESLVVHRIEP